MKRVFLHVGLMKTGTSYLQNTFMPARAELAAQGLALLPDTQLGANRISFAVRKPHKADDDRAVAGLALLDRIGADAEQAPGERCLLTEESLAYARAPRIRLLAEHLAPHELDVVVTVRDLARAVPSMWQQRVKHGREVSLDDYVAELRSGEGQVAKWFWFIHDLPTLLARWESVVPADRIHVVVVPPPGSAPRELLTRFCSVLGVDDARLPEQVRGANPSLGQAQVELLRRVNERLDAGMLDDARHAPVVKRLFANDVLAGQGGDRVRLPETCRPWADEWAGTAIEGLRAGGYDVVGDPSGLRPGADAFVSADADLAERAVSDAAVRALVTVLERLAESPTGDR